jgi:hypothetical protein
MPPVPPTIDPAYDDGFLFNAFQTHMAVHLPFVVIERHINSNQLRHEKPFLYRIVNVAASSRQVARQAMLRQEIMKELTERLLLKNEKSLELLQGMLVFLAWFHYSLPLPQLTNLVQLSVALAHDLGLHKSLRGSAKHEIFILESKCAYERLVIRDPRTLDERRAYLGVFWLQSA